VHDLGQQQKQPQVFLYQCGKGNGKLLAAIVNGEFVYPCRQFFV
jgi:hypothetical protein